MNRLVALGGNGLELRPVVPGDAEDRLCCGRTAEFVHMCGGDTRHMRPMRREDAQAWYERCAATEYSWALAYEGRCIGHARLDHVDGHDRRARYAIGIFDASCWGQGIGTRATRWVLAYAFNILHLHRVDLRVLEYNHRAISCYRHCGFQVEGRERSSALVDGAWYDDLMMSILEDEFRALAPSWFGISANRQASKD